MLKTCRAARLHGFGLLLMVLMAGCSAPVLSTAPTGFDPAEALADGTVSDAEYRLAKEAELRCMQGRGWETSDLRLRPDGVTLGFSVADVDGKDSSADSGECGIQYSADVEMAYMDQHRLTGAEKEAALDSLFQCFVDVPVEGVLRSDSSKQLLRKASTQYPDVDSEQFSAALDCMYRHQWAITDQDDPDE